ncbi:pickpocket protein 28 [Folsomia candida]|uniref:pickpocket protein 28 n=1 Tax=Folsomia candida TaxID=158441 RepID=UPI000B8F7A3B|nr:pickpocket protein 28 [Folsomia candida]
MDVEGGIEMRPAQEDKGSREVCRHIQRSSYPRLVDMFKRRWRNLRIRWQNLMKFEPSQENACVRILHKVPGLRQSAKAGLHVLARAFWLLVFVLCVGIVFYIIREGIRRTMGHPLTVTFETEEINIGDAKFPQVGIGPYSGFKLSSVYDVLGKQRAVRIGVKVVANDGSAWSKNDVEGVMKVIDHGCDGGAIFANKNNVKISDNEHSSFAKTRELLETHVDNITNPGVQQRVIPFIKEGMIKCADTIKGCLLNGKSYNCSLLFKEHFSAWGSTCVFNGIPVKATRRYSTIQSELGGSTNEEIKMWVDADLDEDVANVNRKFDAKRPAIPWRQMAPGKLSGLTFAIKEELDRKACIHGEGTGFTLALNNPRDEVQVERFVVTLPYGREIDVTLYPEVLLAEKDAKDVAMNRRGWYLSDDKGEALLDFYKKYSRQNCLEECFAKAVYEKCKCAKVSSPGLPGRTLCSYDDLNLCVQEKEEQMHNQGLKLSCPKCLPNCRDIKYRTSVTSSRMTESRMNDYQAMGDSEFRISVVNVFFMVDSIHPTRRSARYSTFEEVGLVGGTVSMITGLTLLDIIEALVLIAVIAVAKYKVWNNLRTMGGPSFN